MTIPYDQIPLAILKNLTATFFVVVSGIAHTAGMGHDTVIFSLLIKPLMLRSLLFAGFFFSDMIDGV